MDRKRDNPDFVLLGWAAVLGLDFVWLLVVIPPLARASTIRSEIFDGIAAPMRLWPAWENDVARLARILPEMEAPFRFAANSTMLEILASTALFCGWMICCGTRDAGARFTSSFPTAFLSSAIRYLAAFSTVAFAAFVVFFATHGMVFAKIEAQGAVDAAIRTLRTPILLLLPLKCSILLLVFAQQGKRMHHSAD